MTSSMFSCLKLPESQRSLWINEIKVWKNKKNKNSWNFKSVFLEIIRHLNIKKYKNLHLKISFFYIKLKVFTKTKF